jgi:predicted signal transduction protein with EAL and GGDEF domain
MRLMIKIDRFFVHELANSEDCASIVSAVEGFGRSFRIGTATEGTEAEDQLLLVRVAGCAHALKYLFSRPAANSSSTVSVRAQV